MPCFSIMPKILRVQVDLSTRMFKIVSNVYWQYYVMAGPRIILWNVYVCMVCVSIHPAKYVRMYVLYIDKLNVDRPVVWRMLVLIYGRLEFRTEFYIHTYFSASLEYHYVSNFMHLCTSSKSSFWLNCHLFH